MLNADGDQWPDVVSASVLSGVSLFRGYKHGLSGGRSLPFDAADASAGARQPLSELAAYRMLDLNGDGIADVVGLEKTGLLFTLHSDARSGSWQINQRFQLGLQKMACSHKRSSVFFGDVNDDGHHDVVVVEESCSDANHTEVAVLLRSPTTGKLSAARRSTLETGIGSETLAVCDLNRDGRPDLITSGGYALGAGDETFRDARNFSWRALLPPQSGSYIYRMFAADVDGKPGCELVASVDNRGGVMRYQSNGQFALVGQPFDLLGKPDGAGAEGQIQALADLDADGDQDLIVSAMGSLYLFANDGSGGFAERKRLGQSGGNGEVHLGDVNGDGLLDLLAVAFLAGHSVYGPAELYLLENSGDGSFAQTLPIPLNASTSLSVVDIDGDGLVDLVDNHAHRVLMNVSQ
jgi:hypothetical protein